MSRAAWMGSFRSLRSEVKASLYLFFFMYQRGDSGQRKMRKMSGMAGMKALPIWRRHEMSPVFPTARFAQTPRKIPKATHSSTTRRQMSVPHFRALGSALKRRGGNGGGGGGAGAASLTPSHDQGSTDSSRRVLGGEDGHGTRLRTHSKTQEQAAYKQLVPVLAEGASEHRPETEVGGDKDGATAAEVMVQGSESQQPMKLRKGSLAWLWAAGTAGGMGNTPTTKVRSGIDETNNVGVVVRGATDTEGIGERQVGAVATLLIPTLNGGTNGAGNNGQVQETRDTPLMLDFLDQDVLLCLRELPLL